MNKYKFLMLTKSVNRLAEQYRSEATPLFHRLLTNIVILLAELFIEHLEEYHSE